MPEYNPDYTATFSLQIFLNVSFINNPISQLYTGEEILMAP
jgi:hypothetical protein